MKAIHAMILQQRASDIFAGKVVAQMIRRGASADLMARKGISGSVANWCLGSGAWKTETPSDSATYLLGLYRRDYIFEENRE